MRFIINSVSIILQLEKQIINETNPVGINTNPTVTVGFKKPINRWEIWKINGKQLIVKIIGNYVSLLILHMVHLFLSEITLQPGQL